MFGKISKNQITKKIGELKQNIQTQNSGFALFDSVKIQQFNDKIDFLKVNYNLSFIFFAKK